MHDTDPEVEQCYRAKMAARSGSERVRMIADMTDDGRRLLLSRYDGSPENEKEWLFRTLYERDLPEWYIEDFVRWLRKRERR